MPSEGEVSLLFIDSGKESRFFYHDCCYMTKFSPLYNQLSFGFQIPFIFTWSGREFVPEIKNISKNTV
jgi:hypothetical protein